MGTSLNMVKADNPELGAALEEMRDQLLLAFVRRLGGRVKMPVNEVDETGKYILDMDLEQKPGREPAFVFRLRKKQ